MSRRALPPSRSLVCAPVNTVPYVNAECVLRQFDMTNTGIAGDNYVVINRYDYGGIYPAVGSSVGVNDSPRFNQLRTLYREFAITGVKIELTPADRESVPDINGNAANNLLLNFSVYDEINIIQGWTVPNYQNRYLSQTFKQLDPNKTALVYRDNKPLAKQMNTPWMNANPSAFTVSTGGPRAVTVIGWRISNPNQQANYGSLRVTYYVTFRGQKVL